MVQMPVAENVTEAPVTVQVSGVSEAKLTSSPELAVAASATVVPTAWLGMASNVIVCADRGLEEMFPPQPLRISAPTTRNDKELRNETNGFIASTPEQGFPGSKGAKFSNGYRNSSQ